MLLTLPDLNSTKTGGEGIFADQLAKVICALLEHRSMDLVYDFS